MRFRCMMFGHAYRIISSEKSVIEKKELAKHEYDELRVYKCKRCGKEIIQEEHYQ
ncbi:MAG: hypothetical protein JSW11_17480 [Candidatus Heimdallarchaeota archaeon]|nr:MAG: hypothetical protein JSW11_17480 [Candidatus Heimdallarchaeota archaeon]